MRQISNLLERSEATIRYQLRRAGIIVKGDYYATREHLAFWAISDEEVKRTGAVQVQKRPAYWGFYMPGAS